LHSRLLKSQIRAFYSDPSLAGIGSAGKDQTIAV